MVTDAKFVQGFIRMCSDGFEQGWHERNGGNLSYRIKDEEIKEVASELKTDRPWQSIGTSVPKLAKEYFLVSGSGKYMRNVPLCPEENICIVELDDKGENYIVFRHKNETALVFVGGGIWSNDMDDHADDDARGQDAKSTEGAITDVLKLGEGFAKFLDAAPKDEQ